MARMIPPRYNPLNKNYGEKHVFELFDQSQDTSGWIVLHSLIQQKHIKRKYGEIDFLVLAPKYGIFCLEVKGSHRIAREGGMWKYYNANGKLAYKKSYGPFDQAHASMNTLIKYISEKLGTSYTDFNFGYGVIFPRHNYTINGPDEDPYMIYDSVKINSMTIGKYIQIMSNNFALKSNRKPAIPNKNNIIEIFKELRGDFELVPSTSKVLEDSRDLIKKYTEQQLAIFDSHRNHDRIVVKGGAGTGKTIIAIESAKRLAFNKNKVLLTCFNKQLGLWLKSQFSNEELDYITVGNIHSVVYSLLDNEISSIDTFKDEAPYKILKLVEKGDFEYFDSIIVDEAQDLIDNVYLDIFSLLLDGTDEGLKKGNWVMLGDFLSQALFTDRTEDDLCRGIEKRIDGELHICRIDRNIRNVKEVALAAVFLSGLIRKPFSISAQRTGPRFINWYKQDDEQIDKILLTLKQYKKLKYAPSSIIILSPNTYENSIISKIQTGMPPVSNYSVNKTDKNIKFSTIHSFKGLEMENVIVVDIDDISSETMMNLFYTAATRSTFSLTLFIHQSLQELFIRRQSLTNKLYSDEL